MLRRTACAKLSIFSRIQRKNGKCDGQVATASAAAPNKHSGSQHPSSHASAAAAARCALDADGLVPSAAALPQQHDPAAGRAATRRYPATVFVSFPYARPGQPHSSPRTTARTPASDPLDASLRFAYSRLGKRERQEACTTVTPANIIAELARLFPPTDSGDEPRDAPLKPNGPCRAQSAAAAAVAPKRRARYDWNRIILVRDSLPTVNSSSPYNVSPGAKARDAAPDTAGQSSPDSPSDAAPAAVRARLHSSLAAALCGSREASAGSGRAAAVSDSALRNMFAAQAPDAAAAAPGVRSGGDATTLCWESPAVFEMHYKEGGGEAPLPHSQSPRFTWIGTLAAIPGLPTPPANVVEVVATTDGDGDGGRRHGVWGTRLPLVEYLEFICPSFCYARLVRRCLSGGGEDGGGGGAGAVTISEGARAGKDECHSRDAAPALLFGPPPPEKEDKEPEASKSCPLASRFSFPRNYTHDSTVRGVAMRTSRFNLEGLAEGERQVYGARNYQCVPHRDHLASLRRRGYTAGGVSGAAGQSATAASVGVLLLSEDFWHYFAVYFHVHDPSAPNTQDDAAATGETAKQAELSNVFAESASAAGAGGGLPVPSSYQFSFSVTPITVNPRDFTALLESPLLQQENKKKKRDNPRDHKGKALKKSPMRASKSSRAKEALPVCSTTSPSAALLGTLPPTLLVHAPPPDSADSPSAVAYHRCAACLGLPLPTIYPDSPLRNRIETSPSPPPPTASADSEEARKPKRPLLCPSTGNTYPYSLTGGSADASYVTSSGGGRGGGGHTPGIDWLKTERAHAEAQRKLLMLPPQPPSDGGAAPLLEAPRATQNNDTAEAPKSTKSKTGKHRKRKQKNKAEDSPQQETVADPPQVPTPRSAMGFPPRKYLLKNLAWFNRPYTLAEEMRYGLIIKYDGTR